MKLIRLVIIVFTILYGAPSYTQCGDPLLELCYPKLGDYKFVNSFPIRMKKAKKNEPPTVIKQSLILNSGVKYRFVIRNADEYEGKLVVNLYNTTTLVGSSYEYQTGKFYDTIEFDCKRPGVYYISFYFDGGKEGCAMCLMGQKQ